MSLPWLPQNPGIDLIQFTDAEVLTIQNISGLGDPGADRILFWDESANAFAYLTAGSGLTITGTTISATSGGTGTVTDVSVVTANGISGSVATSTTTPAITLTLGAITPTTVNGLTISTTTGTLTLTNAKTLSVTNSLTFSGTDGTTMTFPTTSATLARTDAANTFTGHQTIEGVTSTGATGTGKFVFDNTPTLLTPVFTGLPTGTGVASAATVSTLAARDANGNLSMVNSLEGYATTATAAGTTTLTVGSANMQYFTGSTTQTVQLPVTSTLVLGQSFWIVNLSSGAVTVNSSGSNAVVICDAGTSVEVTCILTSGTTAASWNAQYFGTINTSGKKLSVSNTLTLAGTDGTTMTFPTTSKTIAANDGSNWTIASQAIGDLLVASSTTAYDRLAAVAAGKYLRANGTGAAPVWSTPTLPNTAVSRKVMVGDGTNWVESTETYAIPGTSGNVLTSDGTNWTSAAPVVTTSNTVTFTNKRINPRLVTAASYTTDTGTSLDVSTCDQFEVTAQAGALLFNAPGGTPLGGQKLIIRIKDNGTARALTYNAVFRAMGNALPSTTVLSKTLYMGFIYNATDTKWDLVAVAQEA